MKNTVDNSLLSFLRCPITGQELEASEEQGYLISKESRNRYKIVNGVPALITELKVAE